MYQRPAWSYNPWSFQRFDRLCHVDLASASIVEVTHGNKAKAPDHRNFLSRRLVSSIRSTSAPPYPLTLLVLPSHRYTAPSSFIPLATVMPAVNASPSYSLRLFPTPSPAEKELTRSPSGTNAPTDTWTLVELGMAVVSACLPTYRALFVGISDLTKRGTSYNTGSKTATNNSSSANGLTLQQSHAGSSKSGAFTKLSALSTEKDSVSELERGRSEDVTGHGF